VSSDEGGPAPRSALPDLRERVGAYGFRLSGPLPPESLRVRGVAHWPALRIEVVDNPTPAMNEYVLQRPEGAVCLDHDLRVARLPGTTYTPLPDLVHPVFAAVGTLAAWARGEVVLHAGAFVGESGAWVVLGNRERGKSTLLAEQHLRGLPIVADDICVIRETVVCAGPRSLDLRPDAAARLEIGLENPVRQGQRYRVNLPIIEGEVPLAGFVELEWSSEVKFVPLPPAERLRRLLTVNGRNPRVAPSALLELAALPYFVLYRSPTEESGKRALSLLANACPDVALRGG
jgi:hypothetical protein